MRHINSRLTDDPGLGSKLQRGEKRKKVINDDGSFNVKRKGDRSAWLDIYHFLVGCRWSVFMLLVFSFYLAINMVFAFSYYFLGAEYLSGVDTSTTLNAIEGCFFFSTQTFTTVGYGAIAPKAFGTGMLASFEALIGVLSFTIITGLLFVRFSKPRPKILFSRNAIISPYGENGAALMFRIANTRRSEMMEVEARVILTMMQEGRRIYRELSLERNHVYFFPLNWTIVHPINEQSALFGISREDLEKSETELLVMVKGHDETYSQMVHSRYSYPVEDFVWNARFTDPYRTLEDGTVLMELDKLHEFTAV